MYSPTRTYYALMSILVLGDKLGFKSCGDIRYSEVEYFSERWGQEYVAGKV